MTEPQTICIGCGCTDEDACPGGCSWLRVDEAAGAGVCSNCPDFLDDFDAGDRSGEYGPVEPERAAGELILPGDPEFHL